MSVEKPMRKVMIIGEWDKSRSIMFRAECDCGHQDHDMTIDIEIDKNDIVSINFYKKMAVNAYYWYDPNDLFFDRIIGKVKSVWKRIKVCTEILFTGFTKMESEFTFLEKEHIEDFIKALEYGKEKIGKWQEDQKTLIK